jgi:hypothetical protein
MGGLAVGVAALAYLHLAPTGLSALRDAVSRYGISPFRGFYRVMTLGLAVAGAAHGVIAVVTFTAATAGALRLGALGAVMLAAALGVFAAACALRLA